ncbi:MAG TPA: pilus assembly protein [Aliiroseovarius sp.]|nr:pilus assembly protein [Aliiroseovarius sp.]
MNTFTHFLNDESGAVTVDWVVLTAAIVGLGIAVLTTISSSVEDVASAVDTQLNSMATLDTTLDGS